MPQTSSWCPWRWQTCWWVSWSCPCRSLQSCMVSGFPPCLIIHFHRQSPEAAAICFAPFFHALVAWGESVWTWAWVCAEVHTLSGEGNALLGAELVSMLPGMTCEWCWCRVFLLLRPRKNPCSSESACYLFGWTAPKLARTQELREKLRNLFVIDPALSQVGISPWAPTDIGGVWTRMWLRKEVCTSRFAIQIKAFTLGIYTWACLVPFRGSFCLSVPQFPYL